MDFFLMASRRKENQESVRLLVMRLISQDPKMSTRKIADAIGISNGSAYYVITALVEKGFVKLHNFRNNPHKGGYARLLTPKGIREKSTLTYRFVERKRIEYQNLQLEIEELEQEIGEASVKKT